MPTRCEACFAYRFKAEYGHGYCRIANTKVLGHGNARLNNCPLVEIPLHGRLIDADVLFRTMEKTPWYNNADRDDIAEELVLNAPTIIETEDGAF